MTHWSKYENWDPYEHYLVAKDNVVYKKVKIKLRNFYKFCPNRSGLYALHTYLCYLKFGFGRATQDAGIELEEVLCQESKQ